MKTLIIAMLLGCALDSAAARAADTANALPDSAPVAVTAVKNPGTLDYAAYYGLQRKLLGYMPSDHAYLQPFLRLSFTHLTADEQDSYAPADWAVAVVGENLDQPVATLRGGYFMLPPVTPAAADGASILFNAKTRSHFLAVAWSIPPEVWPRLDVAAVRAALQELRATQANIPWYALGLRTEKYDRPDRLKVCFEGAGSVSLGEKRYASRSSGCALVPLPDLDAVAPPALAFDGRLAFISLANSAGYE